ncbi:hypothetical protein BH09PLA1_BH09PLA1_04620 [soil metagenome]
MFVGTSSVRGNLKTRNILALAGAVTVSTLCAQAQAFTYLWTRGSLTSSNWSNSSNWSPQDGGTLPLPTAATDTDILYAGTPLSAGNNTPNGDYTIRTITINADFATGSLNFSVPSTGSSVLTLGSGGITSNQNTYQVKFTFQAAQTADVQKIVIAAPQTWHNLVSGTGAGTLSVDRNLEGGAANTITKTGPGLLILSRDNSAFLGGFNLNEGTIRLQNNSNAIGAGTLSTTSANLVGITASTDLPQTIAGQINFGGNGTTNFGGSFPFTWNGQVNMLGNRTVSNSATVSLTANGAFTGPGRYIKTGGGTLTLNAATNTHVGFDVISGVLPFDSDAKLGATGNALGVGGGITTMGTAVVTAPITSSRPISLLAGGMAGAIDTGANNVTFGQASGAGGLTKLGAGVLTLSHVRAGETLTVSEGKVVIAANGTDSGTSRLGSLALAGGVTPTTSLDLKNNDLVVVSGTYAGVTGLIANARNGGAWNQPGLISSTAGAANPKNTTFCTLTGAEYTSVGGTTFDGFTVVGSDVLVKYTYYGDTDFNGQVNFDDYSRIDAGFNNNRTGWLNGDFDYNNTVNFDDYSLIDNAFNTQSGTLRRAMSFLDGSDRNEQTMDTPALQLVVEHYTQFGEGYAQGFLNAVPEPTGVALISGLAALTASKRRRKNNVDVRGVR